jgi:uncharacterized membrane protein
MAMPYLVHIVAGALGLMSGFVALYSAKGQRLHRQAGMVFVFAMLTMAVFGTLIAAVRGVAPAINIPAGVLTAYLVLTGLAALRPPAVASRHLAIAAVVVALAVGLSCLALGVDAVARGGKGRGAAFPLFMFSTVGLLAAAGDVRILRTGAPQGAARLTRHLWRMSFALFIAALSFFIGQAKVIPQPLRIMPLLALPVVAVLVTMIYWLRRVGRTSAGRDGAVVPRPGRLITETL